MTGHILLCHHNDIFGKAESPYVAVNGLRGRVAVRPVRHDNQHVDIAVRPHVAVWGRPEHHGTP